MLDIIIPHYTEPWTVGQKFFDMLNLQRGVDFDKVHVILVNDGQEHALPNECFMDMPYKVEQISIPHAGVSAARNEGLRRAEHEWVMFCDFDDMLAHVYALRDIMAQLPAPGYDALWTETIVETMHDSYINAVHHKEMTSYIHGKIYRRKYLLDNGIMFDTDLAFGEDHVFNMIAFKTNGTGRKGKLVTPMPSYVWCWQQGSVTLQPERQEENVSCRWKADIELCGFFKRKRMETEYGEMVAKTIWDAYYMLNVNEPTETEANIQADFVRWYRDNHFKYLDVDVKTRIRARGLARHECKKSGRFRADISVEQWLDNLGGAT